MRPQILINSGQQILDFDATGNMKATQDLAATVYLDSNLYAVKNILYFNQTKQAFKMEITVLQQGYGLILVGFKSGDFYGTRSNLPTLVSKRATNSPTDWAMQRFNGPITKIELFGSRIAVSTTNEILILDHHFAVIKKMSMLTNAIKLNVCLYCLDLSSLRVYDKEFNEIDRILGRYNLLCVSTVGDLIILGTNQKLVKLVQGVKKELDVGELIVGICLTSDEKLLVAWSADKALLINVENMVVLQEIYSGPITNITCSIQSREFVTENLLQKRRDYTSERLDLLKKFKPSTLLETQNHNLYNYAESLKILNDDLIAQLKSN